MRHLGRTARVSERTPLLRGSRASRNAQINWKETWHFVRPYIVPRTLRLRALAVCSVVSVIFSKLLALVPPYAYKLAVDDLTDNLVGVEGPAVVPYVPIALYVGARIGSGVLSGVQDYCYANVATSCARQFSVDMFDHLQHLSLAFHLQRKTGEVTKVLNRGSSSIDTIANTVIFTLFPTFFEAAVVTGIFLKLGTPFIALTTALTVGLYFLFTFTVTRWRIKFRRDVIDAENAVSEKAVDTLINYETVKMFGMEQEESSLYHRLQKAYQDAYIWFRITLTSLNFGQKFIQTVGLGAAMLLAAIGAAKGQLSPGDFVLVSAYVLQLFQPLFFLGSSYRILVQAATDLELCLNLINTEITVKDKDNAKDLIMSNEDVVRGSVGQVRFQNVCFKYEGGDRGNAGGLRDISFTVAPGRMVALVGASGAGKSTIIRLLLRFYDVDSGAVLIDGEDVRNFSQRSLRKHIGVVAQDTVLFNDTLRYNISYGKQDASDAEIYHAARSAALGAFVDALPLKLDTVVGERGVRLSGGERQRVGCARCIIKAPSIVLLDEASSALDTNTEREMQANLREVCRNRTTIVIAHRLSTIMMADEIIVLGKDSEDETIGTIIERGSHAELVEQGGVYADMWKAQTTVDAENSLSATSALTNGTNGVNNGANGSNGANGVLKISK